MRGASFMRSDAIAVEVRLLYRARPAMLISPHMSAESPKMTEPSICATHGVGVHLHAAVCGAEDAVHLDLAIHDADLGDLRHVGVHNPP